MTRLILVALLGFGLAGLLGLDTADALGRFGHGKGTPGGGRAAGLATLELTDGQKEQLQSLHQQHRAKMQALKELGDISREDVRALRERHREAFMGVLTGEQRAQLEAQKAEWGGALMRLGLGDDQKAQLQVLREQHREQMSALKASEEVGREQDGPRDGPR